MEHVIPAANMGVPSQYGTCYPVFVPSLANMEHVIQYYLYASNQQQQQQLFYYYCIISSVPLWLFDSSSLLVVVPWFQTVPRYFCD